MNSNKICLPGNVAGKFLNINTRLSVMRDALYITWQQKDMWKKVFPETKHSSGIVILSDGFWPVIDIPVSS